MATITEDYVSFEIAKLLKEKGFPLPSTNFRDWICCMYDENGDIQWGCYHPDYYCRVTLQMAMKWLREEHYIYADPIKQGNYNDCSEYFTWIVARMGIIHRNPSVADKLSYEEACEAAIKYCLENLI